VSSNVFTEEGRDVLLCLVRSLRYGLILFAGLVCSVFLPGTESHAQFQQDGACRYTFFNVPGAAYTNPPSINESLSVTDTSSSEEGFTVGFVRTAYGQLTTFDVMLESLVSSTLCRRRNTKYCCFLR
jgi:hypothetical protein